VRRHFAFAGADFEHRIVQPNACAMYEPIGNAAIA
jgi:hypothetical protein